MTDTVELVIPGTPTAKGRPRFYNGRAVTDAKTRAAEQSVLSVWLYTTNGSRTAHEGPVSLEVVATFSTPASWPKWRREAAEAGEWPHLSKPDLDNLLKVVDGLNGVAWKDDSQLTRVSGRKQYGMEATTTITITFHPAPMKPEKGN